MRRVASGQVSGWRDRVEVVVIYRWSWRCSRGEDQLSEVASSGFISLNQLFAKPVPQTASEHNCFHCNWAWQPCKVLDFSTKPYALGCSKSDNAY